MSVTIEFLSSRSPAEAGRADLAVVVLDPFPDPGGSRLTTRLIYLIVSRVEESLRCEPDTDEFVRRPAIAPPQTAVLAGEGVIVLAAFGLPSCARRPRPGVVPWRLATHR